MEGDETLEVGDVYLDGVGDWEPVQSGSGNRAELVSEAWTKRGAIPQEKGVEWDDVIGLEEAKAALQEAIEAQHKFGDIYGAFGIKPPKGVLMYGPPGCGKTMLGKAAASAMAKVHGKKSRHGFFYFNGAEMIGPGFSSEVDWVKNAFKKAEDFTKKEGYPAVLFFDECDSMLPDRARTNFFVKNAVNIFLSKMGGMDAANAFIILATNNHHELDSAAIREGRIDRKIYVGPPNKTAVKSIILKTLEGKPILDFHGANEIADRVISSIFKESRFVGDVAMSELLNGANATGIVNRAAGFAFREAIALREAGKVLEKHHLSIAPKHFDMAVDALHKELCDAATKKRDDVGRIEITHKIENEGDKF